VAQTPQVSFGGPYRAADLPGLYGDVHFCWAIDYMEAGQNSDWLLPNRIYESGRFGVVPIALSGVETGRWLAAHGLGVRLGDPGELEAFLDGLTPHAYRTLRAAAEAAPRGAFTATVSDCRQLVEGLKSPYRPVGSRSAGSLAPDAGMAA